MVATTSAGRDTLIVHGALSEHDKRCLDLGWRCHAPILDCRSRTRKSVSLLRELICHILHVPQLIERRPGPIAIIPRYCIHNADTVQSEALAQTGIGLDETLGSVSLRIRFPAILARSKISTVQIGQCVKTRLTSF